VTPGSGRSRAIAQDAPRGRVSPVLLLGRILHDGTARNPQRSRKARNCVVVG
jgi:hypothetical protein